MSDPSVSEGLRDEAIRWRENRCEHSGEPDDSLEPYCCHQCIADAEENVLPLLLRVASLAVQDERERMADELRAVYEVSQQTTWIGLLSIAKSNREVLEAPQWLPIETAPKDGSDILVLHPDQSVCISYWGSIRGVYGLKSKLHNSASGGEGDFCWDAIGWMPLPPIPPPDSPEEQP